MSTFLLEEASESFHGYLLTLLINCISIKEVLRNSDQCEENCIISELKHQIQQIPKCNFNAIKQILDPSESNLIEYFERYLAYYLHLHCLHTNKECPQSCSFHNGFYLMGEVIYTCKNGHESTESIPPENYIFQIDAYKYFFPCPPIIKESKDSEDSLICCYVEKIINNFIYDDS